MKTFNKIFDFLKSALSEANGSGSSTRLSGYTLVIAWVFFGIMIFVFKRAPELAGSYLDLTAGLISALLVVKVVKDANTKDSTAQALPPAPTLTNQTTQP